MKRKKSIIYFYSFEHNGARGVSVSRGKHAKKLMGYLRIVHRLANVPCYECEGLLCVACRDERDTAFYPVHLPSLLDD